MDRCVGCVLLLPVVLALSACHRSEPKRLTPFEQRHQTFLKGNPAGLHLELRTLGGQTTFRLFETIRVELAFSSEKSCCVIEMDERMNADGKMNWFEADPAESVLGIKGYQSFIICCGSERLSVGQAEPRILNKNLTDYLRFKKPGHYQVFFTTRRVFTASEDAGKRPLVTSNLIWLHILPEDPDWDARRLDQIHRQLQDPAVKQAYEAAIFGMNAGSVLSTGLFQDGPGSQSEWQQAWKSLAALDTPAAIRERVDLWDLDEILVGTVRPDLVAAAMTDHAQAPAFAVDYRYAMLWAAHLAQRDHPERFGPYLTDQRWLGHADRAAYRGVLSALQSAVKNPPADIT